MMQIKGESECRNGMYGVVGAPDELCGFEKIRDLGLQEFEDCGEGSGSGAQRAQGCMSRNDFVRYALLTGLRERQRIGVNPYPFGFIGSTDNHMATPGGVTEYDVPHKFGVPIRRLLAADENKRAPAFWNPGGLAGVWAEENSRDSIFDALSRRETFATSGPRIVPRFFAGFRLDPDVCTGPDLAKRGYATGVPMGGRLGAPPPGVEAPTFAVAALADSGTASRPGGLLQRVQIEGCAIGVDSYDKNWRYAGGGRGRLVDCDLRGNEVDLRLRDDSFLRLERTRTEGRHSLPPGEEHRLQTDAPAETLP